ncbi:MAG: hypothetical protein CMJ58_16840 [Planctomycetaceae bacterium]|nr:hypothetical protein [Planctomycetaceae bacterium]
MGRMTLTDDLSRRREQIAAERAECERLELRFGAALDALTPAQLESALWGCFGRGAEIQAARIARHGLRSWTDRLPLLQLLEAKEQDGPHALTEAGTRPARDLEQQTAR